MAEPHDMLPLDRLLSDRQRPDRRLRVVEAGSSRPASTALLSRSDVERLLRCSLVDIEPAAALILASFPLGGRIETIARLVLAGRLAILEEAYEEPVLTGTRPQAQRPPEEPPGPGPAEELGWIEVTLVDEEDRPIAGEDYKITLPDGSLRVGKLDAAGRVRVDGIPQGTCWVQFPSLGRGGSSAAS